MRPRRTVPVLAVFVPDLSSRPPSAVLPVLEVARVEVAPDDPLVEFRPRDVAERGDGVLVGKEPATRELVSSTRPGSWEGRTRPHFAPGDPLYEAEPAGSLLVPVEAHDDPLDVPDAAEQLVNLLLGRKEAACRVRSSAFSTRSHGDMVCTYDRLPT